MLHICVVSDTSAKSVPPAVEVVVRAPAAEVHPTDGTGLWLGVILGPCSCAAPLSVSRLQERPHLPADVFGSTSHDEVLCECD